MEKIYNKEDARKILQSIYGSFVEHEKIAELINKSKRTEFSTSYLRTLGKIIEKDLEKTKTR